MHVVQKDFHDIPSLAELENNCIDSVLNEIWDHYNDDGNEYLDHDEISKFVFVTLIENGNRIYNEFGDLRYSDNLQKCFEELDEDGSGTVCKHELRAMIMMTGGFE